MAKLIARIPICATVKRKIDMTVSELDNLESKETYKYTKSFRFNILSKRVINKLNWRLTLCRLIRLDKVMGTYC